MKLLFQGLLAVLVLATAGPVAARTPQHRHTQAPASGGQAAQLEVTHPWIRVLPGALPGAGYARIRNHGDAPVVIVAAHSRAYGNIMLHKSRVTNGVSQMAAVPKLTIPGHGGIRLQPGGYHLMMMHATRPVRVGHTVPVTLKLADGSTLEVPFKTRPANASSDMQ